jgi:hypothetical protein
MQVTFAFKSRQYARNPLKLEREELEVVRERIEQGPSNCGRAYQRGGDPTEAVFPNSRLFGSRCDLDHG